MHTHDTAEQIWHVLAGSAVLLLAGGRRENVRPGDTVRFSDGEEHGAINDGAEPFVYFSVTAPPLDFRPSYATGWGKPATANVERRPGTRLRKAPSQCLVCSKVSHARPNPSSGAELLLRSDHFLQRIEFPREIFVGPAFEHLPHKRRKQAGVGQRQRHRDVRGVRDELMISRYPYARMASRPAETPRWLPKIDHPRRGAHARLQDARTRADLHGVIEKLDRIEGWTPLRPALHVGKPPPGGNRRSGHPGGH